jgi:hypothetical protein
MFSNRIANSAKFLQMPSESQLLYFHLILRADDDGIVESYPVMKLLGIAPDNFKVLQAREFIKQLNEDQVVVITDWSEHNIIRADRKVNSIYLPLLKDKVPEIEILEPKPRIDVENNSKRVSGQSTDGISKVRLGKVSIGKEITIHSDKKSQNHESLDESFAPNESVRSIQPKRVKKTQAEKEIDAMEPIDFNEKIRTMMKDEDRRVRIIAWYWKVKRFNFKTKGAYETALRRELRPAGNLLGYTGDEIKAASEYCDREYSQIKWTLETISKVINDAKAKVGEGEKLWQNHK